MNFPSRRWAGRLAALLLSLCGVDGAPGDEAWLARSQSILDASRGQKLPDWLSGALEPQGLHSQATAGPRDPAILSPGAADHPPEQRYVLYVSASMGTENLREIIREAQGHRDRLIVFRGLRPGQSLTDFVRSFQSLLKGIDRRQLPAIEIDPTRFQKANVTSVPTLTLESRDQVLAIVRGVSQVGWLRAKLNRDSYKVPSATKDLGTLGSTREIAETDLLERLKENLGKIDWKALQQQFRHRFWEQVSFQNLPETRETREYWIDLSVTAPHDLRGPTGQRLILSGQRVNPLEIMPFRQRLLVFDATRPGQVETVQRLAREAGNRRVVLMATQIDRTKGWDGFAGLENRLQSPVYLLTPELKERFRLKAVPALIEADQFRIRVREIKPKVPA